MTAIGGYFGLELGMERSCYHPDAIPLNLGRTALEYIVEKLQIKKILLPAYICPSVLVPIVRAGAEYEFYRIDHDFSPVFDEEMLDEWCLLYVNYFGLNGQISDDLVRRLSHRVIIDATQAFYYRPPSGALAFYSARKFFGVPDGGYALIQDAKRMTLPRDHSFGRFEPLLKRWDLSPEEGYADYRENETALGALSMSRMSSLTEQILGSIDYAACSARRVSNFQDLHDFLGPFNRLQIHMSSGDVPLVYPLLLPNGRQLREELIDSRIYCPTYWPKLAQAIEKNCFEMDLCHDLVCLPVDQRYGPSEMQKVCNAIQVWLEVE